MGRGHCRGVADTGRPGVEAPRHFPCDPRLHRGWRSGQEWTGALLDLLLDATGRRSFVAWSETGYARRFPIRDLESTWLVTRLGGEPLGPDHGFPARMVAPARRGFSWVKWVARIELSPIPWWLQSPFPLT